MTTRTLATLALLISFTFVLTAPDADAGNIISNIFGKKKKYDENILTPDQLKKCLILKDELKELRENREKLSGNITKTKTTAQQLKGRIDATRGKLDKTSKIEVDGFNALVKEFNRAREEHSQAVARFNAATKDLNAQTKAHNSSCEDKKYYEEDYKEVTKSLERQAE